VTGQPSSPLENLHDVMIPTTAPWWPLSIQAFALIACIIGLITIICFLIVKYKRFNRPKKIAIQESKQLLTVNIENTHALHLLLKRLIKHYYSTAAANQISVNWCAQLERVSKILIDQDELINLYQSQPNQQLASLHTKLLKAVSQFKVKGALDV
jgi:hypothetical protein